jgi:hypothetical protein
MACNRVGEKRNTYKTFVGKPERKRPLGVRKCSWLDNIKMDLREIGWSRMDWICLDRKGTSEGILCTR